MVSPSDKERFNSIDPDEDWEVDWWAQHLGVENSDIREAIQEVGSNSDAVAEYIRIQRIAKNKENVAQLERLLESRRMRRAKNDLVKAVIGLTFAGVALATSASMIFSKVEKTPRRLEVPSANFAQELAGLKAQVADLAQRTENAAVPSDGAIAGIDARLSSLEDAISANPARALSVPLLRKDLDTLYARQEQLNLSSAAEVEELKSQLRWVVGVLWGGLVLLTTSALGILARAVLKPKVEL